LCALVIDLFNNVILHVYFHSRKGLTRRDIYIMFSIIIPLDNEY
jgi:hypothetical protein